MTSVLLSAIAGMGAAQHLVGLAEALLARGHRVSLVSGEQAREAYAHLDVHFHAVPEQAMPDLLQTLPPLPQRARQVQTRMRHNIIEPLPAQWTVVRRVIRDAAIEVVVSYALFLGGSGLAFLPPEERPGLIILGFFPPWVPDPAVPPYGLGAVPTDDLLGRLRAAVFEAVAAPSYLALSRAFNAQVQRAFGVRRRGDLRSTAGADVWAQLTVPRFEYPREKVPANFRFVGPLRPPASDPVPEWWDPAAEPPVVAVRAEGAGAVKDLVVPTVRAFGGTADTVVVAGSSRAAVEAAYGEPIPANVHFEDRLPWPRLIPRRSVVVSDGDYLHTQHALRAGIPLVVSGTLETDVETAARVEWSGAGVNLRRRRPDPGTIRAAVERIRADGAFRTAAARIAVQIATTEAEATLCALVEEHARPARSPQPRSSAANVSQSAGSPDS